MSLGLNNPIAQLFGIEDGKTLISKEDLDALKAYNSEIANGVNPMSAYYKTLQTASDKAVGLANAADGSSVNLNNLTTSSKLATVGLKLLSAAGNMLLSWGLTMALQLAVKWLDKVIVTTDEYKEKLQELKNECQDINSEIQNLNGELETTIERLVELKGKDKLSFTEKDEYDKLVQQNNELRRSIQLLEMEQEVKNREKNKTFVDTMESDTSDKWEYSYDSTTEKVIEGNSLLYSLGGSVYTTVYESEYIDQQFETRKKLLDKKRIAETSEEKQRIQEQIDEIDSYFQTKSEEWANNANGISYISNPTTEDQKKVNKWLDYINDFQDKRAIALDITGEKGAKQNAFNRLVDNWQFDESVQELQDLGNEGKVTAQMLDNPVYDEFIAKLVELGIINSADNLNEIALAFNKVTASIEKTNDELKDSPFIKVASGVQALEKGFDQLDSIMADMINGEDFDYSAFLNNDSFKETFGNLTLATDEYKDAYAEFIETIANSNGKLTSEGKDAFNKLATAYIANEHILDDLSETTKQTTINQLEQMGVANAQAIVEERLNANKEVQLIQNQYLLENNEKLLDQNWETVESELAKVQASEIAIQMMAALKLQQMDLMNNPINMDSNINEILSLAKAAKVGQEEIRLLGELLYWQNILETNYSSYAYSEFSRISKQLNDNVDSWTNVEIAFQKVDFRGGAQSQKALKDATEDATDALEKEKEALEELRNNMDTLHDAIMWFYDKQIDKINDKIDALNDENEVLEKQQENMDRIIAAIEDNYDTEIKKIQDKIDALQDENDEEERALALEEAKRKLQEAKSRKTLMVYQKGVGFTYQVDTKAITEAEEELEELQENEVVAELEKQIEKLEEAKQKWSEIPEAYEKAMQEIAAKNYFGKNWKELTLNPSDDLLNKFEGKYTGIQSSIDKNEDRIERYEKEIDKLEELKQAWEDAKNAYQYAEYEKQLSSYFGSDYEYQLLNNSTVWRQQYAAEYANLCAQIEALEQKIKAANDETANAATSNAETIKTANAETVKSAEALTNTMSSTEEVTTSIVDDAYNKVLTIQNIIVTLTTSIEYLKYHISLLYESMSKMNEIDISNIINQIGGSGGSGSTTSEGKQGGYSMPKFPGGKSGSDSESTGGTGSLLDAINAVIEAIGTSGNVDSSTLIGALSELDNTQLDMLINEFAGENEDGDSGGSLLSAINEVSQAIVGDGKDETSLISSILKLDDASTVKPIDVLCNKFQTLYEKLGTCIEKVESLTQKINALPTGKLALLGISGILGTGTAFTFGTGTAFSGTAYASGTGKWGLPSDKPGSLVAEQGSEIVVRDGKYRLISSPTLMDLKKGDIVFNHKQTEAILKNGKKSVIDNLANKGEKIANNLNGFAYSTGTVTGNAFDAILNGLQLMLQPKNVLPKFAQKFKKLPNNPNEQKVEIHIGDIHVHGVQNVNGLADQIINHLPNTMLQKLNKK